MSEGLRLVVISIAELIADCSLVIGETKYQDNDISGLPGTFLEGESRAFYYPNLDDGLEGIVFVDACVESAKNNCKWISLKKI